MNRKILMTTALICLLMQTPSAHAFKVFDPWNFGQNLRSAIQAVRDEINQLKNLRLQMLQQQGKGDAVQQQHLARDKAHIDAMTANNTRLYQDLIDVREFNSGILAEAGASGLSREQWLAAERELIDRNYDLQQKRVNQAREYHGRLEDSVQVRSALIDQNKSISGAVQGLQVNNEYLDQIVRHLEVMVEQIADEAHEEAESGTAGSRLAEHLIQRREARRDLNRRRIDEFEKGGEALRDRASKPMFNF